jgi:hypothetical protein
MIKLKIFIIIKKINLIKLYLNIILFHFILHESTNTVI